MIFQINGHDYTKYLQDDTYNILQNNIGKSWTDANYKKHIHEILKVQGSFSIAFINETIFTQFLNDINAKNSAGYNVCTLFVINLNTIKTIECFINTTSEKFRPVNSDIVVNILNVTVNEA